MRFGHYLAAFGLISMLSWPAAAQGSLEALPTVVRQLGHDVNLRVEVRNPGPTYRGPFEIHLLIRGADREPYRLIKVWHEHEVPAGQKIARDYLPVGDIDPALRHGVYQVECQVWINGQDVSSNRGTRPESQPQ
jgi:hypothetical protein